MKNGGFAQYFFNCGSNSFDAWFAANDIDAVTCDLLNRAFLRLGHQFDVHLDLARHMKEDEGAQLSAAFKRLIGILARASSGDLAACFATFRDQLSEDGAGLAGLDALDAEFYKTTNVPARLVEFARLHPEAFFSG